MITAPLSLYVQPPKAVPVLAAWMASRSEQVVVGVNRHTRLLVLSH